MSGRVVERWRGGRWGEVFVADRRVEVDHPSGRYRVVACVPGQELELDEARALGLLDADGRPQAPPSGLPPAKDLTRHDVGPEALLRRLGVLPE